MTDAVTFLKSTLDPGIAWCKSLPGWNIPFDPRARLMQLVIPGQESLWSNVPQSGGGPARDPYQQEPETISEILNNPASTAMAHLVATQLYLKPDEATVYAHLIVDPFLAVAFARLDLWCDPHPLPAVGDEAGALSCYVRVWRPGAISRGGARAKAAETRFHTNYQAALAAVRAAP